MSQQIIFQIQNRIEEKSPQTRSIKSYLHFTQAYNDRHIHQLQNSSHGKFAHLLLNVLKINCFKEFIQLDWIVIIVREFIDHYASIER